MTTSHFDPLDISQGELHALQEAAKKAWSDDTRHPQYGGDMDKSKGQCYVTSFWLTRKFGGFIGDHAGHYVWVSPDKKYVIDLTGDKHPYIIYKSIKHPLFKGIEIAKPKATPRAERFADRAETIFSKLGHFAKVAMDYAGDAYPAEEPQKESDREMQDGYLTHDISESKTLNFAYVNGKIIVDDKPLEDLVEEDATGPIALGTVEVDPDDYATWTVKTNIGLTDLADLLKKYCGSVGFSWGGLSNAEGASVTAKNNYLYIVQQNDNVYLSHKKDWSKIASQLDGAMTVGTFSIVDNNIVLPDRTFSASLLESLHEYAEDNSLSFVLAGNDNVIKRIEDLQEHNYSNPLQPDADNSDGQFFNDKEEATDGDVGAADAERINGVYRCKDCDGRLFPSWHEFINHKKRKHPDSVVDSKINEGEPDSGFPDTDPDATIDPHFSPRQPQGVGEITFSSSVNEPPISFIYDVEKDKVFVGSPGTSISDMTTQINEGESPLTEDSTVQGVYDNGKVTLKTTTSIPYTVRHLIRLWYYQHPEKEVKSVELELPTGGTTRLAKTGDLVFAGAMTNPDMELLSDALLKQGAKIFVVGDAITDAELNKEIPDSFELKCSNINKTQLLKTLERLGGSTNLAGYEQGVFLWRDQKISAVTSVNEDRVDLSDGTFTYGEDDEEV